MTPKPASLIAPLDFPEALFAPPGAAERALVDQARARLLGFERQSAIVRLCRAFEALPELQEIVFFSRESSFLQRRVDFSIASNLGHASQCEPWEEEPRLAPAQARLCPGADPGPRERSVLTKLLEWSREARDAGLFELIEALPLRRPADGALLPALMLQALPPEDFARWEAAWLDAMAPAPLDLPSKPPRPGL